MRKAFRGTGQANPGRGPALQAVFLADVLLGLVSFDLNTTCGEILKTAQLQRLKKSFLLCFKIGPAASCVQPS